MQNKGAIAILGGMGPEASAKMLEVMISMAAEKFKAKNGDDFPEIIVDSIPIPDFISNKKNLIIAKRMLKQRIKSLGTLNVSNFAIACNTAHLLLADLELSSPAPFVSIIDAVVAETERRGFKIVSLLASPSTIKTNLYTNNFAKAGISVHLPSRKQTQKIEKIIRRIIARKNTEKDAKALKEIATSLGAEAVVLGCTELPLIFPKDFSLPVLDSIKILSAKLLENFYNN